MAATQEGREKGDDALKVWKTVESDPALVEETARVTGLPPAAAGVLAGLGIVGKEEIARFLDPRLNDLTDPFLLPSMESAAARIWLAIESGETIAVHGDYDVDGISGTALLVSVLRRLGAEHVVPFLPDRVSDGYGLSVSSLNKLIGKCEPRLIITVDCGTNAFDAVRFSAERGIDVIVTDHHETREKPCGAYAVLNPKLYDIGRIKMLAGVGVAFKLCHALLKMGRNGDGKRYRAFDIDLREYLEWVMLGTVADIVPLLGENRTLVRHGLARLNSDGTTGVKALKKAAGTDGCLDTYHAGYMLAPRLNAAGRIGNPETALELLLTDDPGRALEIAMELDSANRERRKIESRIKKEAESEIGSWFDSSRHFGLVVGKRGWHPGVIGIVASRLTAVYGRPVAVVAFDEDGMGRGSCRSIEGYPLLDGLDECREHLVTFGGHEMAAGLKIEEERLDVFRTAFNEAVARTLRGRDLRPVQRVNAWIDLSEIDRDLFDCLESFKPFGQDNPMPVFASRGLHVESARRTAGGKHLKMTLASNGAAHPAIAFDTAGRALPDGPIDAVFCLRSGNRWSNGNIEMNVLDWRSAAQRN